MNCCVQASSENLKRLGQNTLFIQLVTQVLTRAILHACAGVTLAQPQNGKNPTTWNKPGMENGKNILHLYTSTMPCSHATGTQFVQNSSAKNFLCKNYFQTIELSYRTVTSTSTDHLKFNATVLTTQCQKLTRSYPPKFTHIF